MSYHLLEEEEVPVSKTKDPTEKPVNRGALVYQKLCRKYGEIPVKTVSRQFGKGLISLTGYNLSKMELKAFFVALLVCVL